MVKKKKKSKRSFNWRGFLATICFVAAAVLFLIDPFRTYLMEQYKLQGDQAVQNLTVETVKASVEEPANFDFSQVESLNMEGILAAKMNAQNYSAVGIVAVPSVQLNIPIYRGVANEVLLLGAGTLKSHQKMGEGNYALAGHHYNASPSVLFTPLSNLQIGAKIYVTDMEYVYVYETVSITQVEPTAVEVIDDKPGVTEITLIKCNETGELRDIYTGKFIEKIPVTEVTQEIQDAFQIDFTNS